jgi:hypothetical protein
MHEFTATCHTDGCANNGIPITLGYTDEFGPPGTIQCGPCGHPITDTAGLS